MIINCKLEEIYSRTDVGSTNEYGQITDITFNRDDKDTDRCIQNNHDSERSF